MIHMTVLLKRKEGLTKEQFDEHWSNTHATVFLSNPVAREKLVRYSQQHLSSELNGRLAAMGIKQPQADGIVHFWAQSIDDLMAVFESDYYRDVVVPDEAEFIARGQEEMSIGVDEEKWSDGQVGFGVQPSKWNEIAQAAKGKQA